VGAGRRILSDKRETGGAIPSVHSAHRNRLLRRGINALRRASHAAH
jgi:hypothetical protein